MKNEKVSIIIPVYNVEKYLKACIESVVNQTYRNLEIILVDDGSTDKSGAICDEYAQKDNRIKVFHIANGGVSNARNLGLEVATGEWIQFVDSDDLILPSMTETLLKNAEGVDMVVCGVETFPWNSISKCVEERQVFASLKETDVLFQQNYKKGLYNPLWNKLYRREKVTRLFDKTLSLGEDLLFNLKFFENCTGIAVIPDVLYKYRMESVNTLSRKPRKDALEIQCLLKEKVDEAFNFNNKICCITAENMFRSVILSLQAIVCAKSIFKKEKLQIIESWLTDERMNVGLEMAVKNGGASEKFLAWLIKKKKIRLIYFCLCLKK